jgi:hypothetical protein
MGISVAFSHSGSMAATGIVVLYGEFQVGTGSTFDVPDDFPDGFDTQIQ